MFKDDDWTHYMYVIVIGEKQTIYGPALYRTEERAIEEAQRWVALNVRNGHKNVRVDVYEKVLSATSTHVLNHR